MFHLLLVLNLALVPSFTPSYTKEIKIVVTSDLLHAPQNNKDPEISQEEKTFREQLRKVLGEEESKTSIPVTPVIPSPGRETGKEFVERRKREVREELAKRKISPPPVQEDWNKRTREQVQQQQQQWRTQVAATWERWREKQQQFLQHLPDYKKQDFSFAQAELYSKVAVKGAPLRVSTTARGGTSLKEKILQASMKIPVRDQGKRATCSAFAGIRAMEIILWSQGLSWELSSQYFYWASRPMCHQNPCTEKGSWVTSGLQWGQDQSHPDIPLAKDCPYSSTTQSNNETQTPLTSSCLQQGKVRLKQGEALEEWEQVKNALDENRPVVAAFKLSENFYVNNGLVTFADKDKGAGDDSKRDHSQGHALVVIGYKELPAEWKSEGKYCWIVTNSWGEGWGLGGHACLTDRWVQWALHPQALYRLDSLEILD